jgi:hypothetical protein
MTISFSYNWMFSEENGFYFIPVISKGTKAHERRCNYSLINTSMQFKCSKFLRVVFKTKRTEQNRYMYVVIQ